MMIAFVRHASVPQAQITETDTPFANAWLNGRSDLRLILDVFFLDPAAFFGRLLVVSLVSVVGASPDLSS